jgi:putative nucleotidyltransferase with HDIG domain
MDSSHTGTDGERKLSLERVSFKSGLGGFLDIFSTQGISRRELAVLAWGCVLAIATVGLVSGLLVAEVGLGSPYAVGVLVVLALFAERESIRLSPVIAVSFSSLAFIFAGVVFGPIAAIVVGAAGLLVDLPRTDDAHPRLRWLIWTLTRALVAGLAGLAAMAVGAQHTRSFAVLLGATAAAAVVEATAALLLSFIAPALRGTASWREMTKAVVPLQVASVPLHTPVIAILAYAYLEVSPLSVVLFVIPAFAAQRLFLLYRQQRETAEELAAVNARLEKANISFATALVATLDARDHYTAGHSAAVAIYARDIAARMELDEERQQLVHLCGLVHDIGKVGLAPGLLEKPGPLTLDERRRMQEHAVIGERILGKVEDYAEIASIVRHHHERVDGHGYPDRLSEDEIPLLSRIIAVADAYDAMTSDRPYRDAMPSRVARLRLAQAVESQFDTSVVAAFEAILAGAGEDYRLANGTDFSFVAQQGEAERILDANVA